MGSSLTRSTYFRRGVMGGAIAGSALWPAACGRAQGESGGGGARSSAPVTVTMWHIWNGNRTAPFHKSLETLTEKTPQVRVDPTVFDTGAETDTKIVAVAASGDPPDVLMNNQNIFVDLAGGGALLALDERLKVDKLSPSDWYDGAYKSSVWNGKLYGLPAVNSGPRLLYFNKSAFREAGLDANRPPQTWDELQRASQQVVKRDGDSFTRTGWNPAAGTFAQDPFITGKVAMKTDGPFIVPQIKEFGPQLDYSVAPVPRAPQGKFADPMWVNWMYSVPAASKKQATAWAVARWVGHDEGHRFFMLDQQRPGVIKKYNDDPQYPKINPFWKTINEILDKYTLSDQVTPGRGRAIAAMNKHLTRVYTREISARDGLADGVKEAQQELDQAWARAGGGK